MDIYVIFKKCTIKDEKFQYCTVNLYEFVCTICENFVYMHVNAYKCM